MRYNYLVINCKVNCGYFVIDFDNCMMFTNYLSPFSWRYGSPEMRKIWSETYKRKLWRKIWLALAEAQSKYGLISCEQLKELRQHVNKVNVRESLKVEAEIKHDLMAELKVYASQCPTAGGLIHLGATSMDIEDNAEAIRIRRSIDLLTSKLAIILSVLSDLVTLNANLPINGYTHIQPAEPTTLGYRFAQYLQDLWSSWRSLFVIRNKFLGKGFKGAVGTGASYIEIIGALNFDEFENTLSASLDLPFFSITTQTYPRIQDFELTCQLSAFAAIFSKIAIDIRILQSPLFGELMEPISEKQVGSSAMPFKRNPILCEKINSLSRLLSQAPQIAWQNAAYSILERTLDDSANRRTILPESFLIMDELCNSAIELFHGLVINKDQLSENLAQFAPFASTERLLMALVHSGADRQKMHEALRKHAMRAWESMKNNSENPLVSFIKNDPLIKKYLSDQQISEVMSVSDYFGIAPGRSKKLAEEVKHYLKTNGFI